MPAGGAALRFEPNHWIRPLRSVPGGQCAIMVPFLVRRSTSTSRHSWPKIWTTEIGATGNLPACSLSSSLGRLVPTPPGIAFLYTREALINGWLGLPTQIDHSCPSIGTCSGLSAPAAGQGAQVPRAID